MFDDAAENPVHTTQSNEAIPPLTEELYHAEKESLEDGVRSALDELEEEVLGAPFEEMSAEELARAADELRAGEIDYLERQSQNTDPEVARRAEFVHHVKVRMDALLDEVNTAVQSSSDLDVQERVKFFLTEMRTELEGRGMSGEDVDHAITQIQLLLDLDLSLLAADEESRNVGLTLLSLGMDLIPFLGGVKMMGEGALGKTLDGQDLQGTRRLIHMSEGLFWELVDVVSGAAALVSFGGGGAAIQGATKGAKVVKSVPKLTRVLTRSGAFMRKYGIRGSKEVFRTGRFLQKNERAGKVAQKTFEKGVRQRTMRAARAAEQLPEVLTHAEEAHKNHTELLQAINEERAHLTELLDRVS